MRSNITGGPTVPKFQATVLGKYDVTYYECCETGFIQTEAPYWLDEAYSSAITALDLGLVSRNFDKAELALQVINRVFPNAQRFVDYGGGYGMFTRRMRDFGLDFVNYDTHCENLFASSFHLKQLPSASGHSFDVMTAWEVFEHLVSPRESLVEMFGAADAVLFSTLLVPKTPIRDATDWWYFAPEVGQHISFFTERSLQHVAKELSLHFYSDRSCNHILSKHALDEDPFAVRQADPLAIRIIRRLFPQRLTENTLRTLFSRDVSERYLNRLYQTRLIRKSLLESDLQAALSVLRSRS